MRSILSLAAVVATLVLAGGALAADDKPGRDGLETAATAATAVIEGPMSARPAVDDAFMGEPCWGDRYEKDEDLNEGSRISTEEILRIINPVQS